MKPGTPKPKEVIDYYQQIHDDKSLSWCQKIDKVQDYEHKLNPEYRGIGGLTIDPNTNVSPDEISHGLFEMMFSVVKGNYEEVEPEEMLL